MRELTSGSLEQFLAKPTSRDARVNVSKCGFDKILSRFLHEAIITSEMPKLDVGSVRNLPIVRRSESADRSTPRIGGCRNGARGPTEAGFILRAERSHSESPEDVTEEPKR